MIVSLPWLSSFSSFLVVGWTFLVSVTVTLSGNRIFADVIKVKWDHTGLCCCLVTKWCSSFSFPWTIAPQAPLSLGFSRQEHWSGLPFHFLGDLPNPGIKPLSPALAGRFFTAEPYTGLGQAPILGLSFLVKEDFEDRWTPRERPRGAGSFVATSQGMPRIAGSPQRLGKGLKIVPPCEPLCRSQPCDQLEFRLLASRPVRETNFYCFKSPTLR